MKKVAVYKELRGRNVVIEYDSDDIKEHCIVCGESASDTRENDDKRYKERGNFCRECNKKANKKPTYDNYD